MAFVTGLVLIGLPSSAAPNSAASVALGAPDASIQAALKVGTWQENLLDLLRALLFFLGRDPSVLDGVTCEQAMGIVQQQYLTYGIPSTLSATDRSLLRTTASSVLAMLDSAPPDVDPGVVASFRNTMTQLYLEAAPPVPPGPNPIPPTKSPEGV